MFDFTLFRIPIRVQPMYWLSMAVLGYMIASGGASDQREMLLKIAIFMLIAFYSILIHELGHALVGRKLSGSEPAIELVAFGGNARFSSYARFSKWGHRLMVAAGPATNLVISALSFGAAILLPAIAPDRADTLFQWFLFTSFGVNLVWFIFNIIPIYPLDGGQLMHSVIKSPVTAHTVSLALAIVMIVIAAMLEAFFALILFGFMAFQNFEILQAYRRR